eukprot:gene34279-31664_t
MGMHSMGMQSVPRRDPPVATQDSPQLPLSNVSPVLRLSVDPRSAYDPALSGGEDGVINLVDSFGLPRSNTAGAPRAEPGGSPQSNFGAAGPLQSQPRPQAALLAAAQAA